MSYTIIQTIHLLSVFAYGGFLFVDFFFLSKMPRTLNAKEHEKAREAIMMHVRKVVPYALFVAVGTGIYLITQVFGEINSDGLSNFQTLLLTKALLGLWLGFRGFNQKILGLNPWMFKGHTLPFLFVFIVIVLSKFMYL